MTVINAKCEESGYSLRSVRRAEAPEGACVFTFDLSERIGARMPSELADAIEWKGKAILQLLAALNVRVLRETVCIDDRTVCLDVGAIAVPS